MAPTWRPEFDRVIKDLNQRKGGSAERRVAEALNKIVSEDVWILHSLRYSRQRELGAAVNLEIDFLVVWKNRGFLILEVKGGGIDYNAVENRWWCSPHGNFRREYKRSPVKQVEGQKNDLCEILSNILPKELNPRTMVERVLVFPDVSLADFRDQRGQRVERIDDFELDAVVDRERMNTLAEFVEKKLAPCQRYAEEKRIRGVHFDVAINLLRPQQVTANVPPRHILEDSELQIEVATAEQREHLMHVIDASRLLMEGPAGTAKTVLGLSAVMTWLERGESAYYITASRFLVDGLHRDNRYAKVKDRVLTIHDFIEMAYEQHIGESDEQMLAALTGWECPYKGFSLVIDEAQDLDDDLYEGLVSLLPCKQLWVLRDQYQSLDWGCDARNFKVGLMEHATAYSLTKNCRNVRPISEYIASFVKLPDDYVRHIATLHDGEAIEKPVVDSRQEQDDKVLDILKRGERDKWKKDDIVVISCASGGAAAVREKYCSAKGIERFGGIFSYGIESVGKIRVFHALDFRGLESPFIVVTDIEGQESVFRANYLAGSRAKCRLVVIRVNDNTVRNAIGSDIPQGLSFD